MDRVEGFVMICGLGLARTHARTPAQRTKTCSPNPRPSAPGDARRMWKAGLSPCAACASCMRPMPAYCTLLVSTAMRGCRSWSKRRKSAGGCATGCLVGERWRTGGGPGNKE